MGTNYYLHPAPPKCEGCSRPFEDQAPDPIHIGKSSHGWAWAWRGYKPGEACDCTVCGDTHPALDSTQVWVEFLARHIDGGGAILDEYGEAHTLADVIVRVVAKRGGLTGAAEHQLTVNGQPWPNGWVKVVGEEQVIFSNFS